MYKKDYLQRQFEDFGKVMAVLFGLRKGKDHENYTKELNLAFEEYTTFYSKELETMSLETFQDQVESQFGTKPDGVKLLADLLYEQLHFTLEMEENEKARNLHAKCKYLYTWLHKHLSENEFHLDIHYRLSVLNTLGDQLK